jgi:hypothetical protein
MIGARHWTAGYIDCSGQGIFRYAGGLCRVRNQFAA